MTSNFVCKAISNVGIQKLVVTRLLSYEEDRSEEISMFEEFFIYPDFTSEFMTQGTLEYFPSSSNFQNVNIVNLLKINISTCS